MKWSETNRRKFHAREEKNSVIRWKATAFRKMLGEDRKVKAAFIKKLLKII